MGVYNNAVSLLDIIMEVIMIMTNYVSDELANKVYHLTKALNQAEDIVETLQKENDNLKELLSLIENKDQLVDENFLIEA
jgi:hypothetical protein